MSYYIIKYHYSSIQRPSTRGSLYPFLFIIDANELVGLFKSVVSQFLCHPFTVAENMSFDIQQLAYDTIIFGQVDWENVQTLKVILRGFKMASCLRINFHKTRLWALIQSRILLEATSNFLSCSIPSLPFNFLGIPIGINPRRCSSWPTIIDKVCSRLASWKSKFISYGGVLFFLMWFLILFRCIYSPFTKLPRW